MWHGVTDNAWALHREHIRTGRYITLRGGDPRQIHLPSTWPEIEEALLDEIRYLKNTWINIPTIAFSIYAV